jgi:hypothetical protein|tara:strand:+ start:37 stop:480 length:444 start_codon:yes stop_codon:yes gene_type:complete
MELNFCAVCGKTEDLQYHHFTPRIDGGSDDETNILTLCYEHHCEIHGKPYRNKIHHAELTRKGLQRARERGVRLGSRDGANFEKANKVKIKNANEFSKKLEHIIKPLRESGRTFQEIADTLNEMGIKTPLGKCFYPASVRNYFVRIK